MRSSKPWLSFILFELLELLHLQNTQKSTSHYCCQSHKHCCCVIWLFQIQTLNSHCHELFTRRTMIERFVIEAELSNIALLHSWKHLLLVHTRTSPSQKQCNDQLLFSVILLANWYDINFWAILQKFACFVQFCLTVQFTIYQSIACAYHTFCYHKKSRKKHLNFCCVPNSQFCHTNYDKNASFSRNAHIVVTITNHDDFKHVMGTSSN